MQKKDDEKITEKSSLSGECLEAEDVLAGSEPWDPIETKMVVWSFVIAAIALIVGLLIVPTSILY
jgi:hypothetical protein